jgi:predicted nucleic acid-binding protein
VIADSSVWIDALASRPTVAKSRFDNAVASGESIHLLPCILQEILQGASSAERLTALAGLLVKVPILVVPDPVETARQAARLYARCRWSGYTPRSPLDCLIAASCIELDQPLMHSDRDFDAIARIEPRLKAVRV